MGPTLSTLVRPVKAVGGQRFFEPAVPPRQTSKARNLVIGDSVFGIGGLGDWVIGELIESGSRGIGVLGD